MNSENPIIIAITAAAEELKEIKNWIILGKGEEEFIELVYKHLGNLPLTKELVETRVKALEYEIKLLEQLL